MKAPGMVSFILLIFFGKERTAVMAVHEPQDGVTAALERNVEMGHERPADGAIVYQPVAYEVGFEAAYAVAAHPFDCIKSASRGR